MERRLAAILAADVVGYSRLIREDEAGTLAVCRASATPPSITTRARSERPMLSTTPHLVASVQALAQRRLETLPGQKKSRSIPAPGPAAVGARSSFGFLLLTV
jgi:hypothetical protein